MGKVIAKYSLVLILALFATELYSQQSIKEIDLKMDYSRPTEFEVGGITVSGAQGIYVMESIISKYDDEFPDFFENF